MKAKYPSQSFDPGGKWSPDIPTKGGVFRSSCYNVLIGGNPPKPK